MDANTTPPRNGANAQPSSPLLPDGSPGILHELAALVGSEPTDDDAAGHIEQPHTDIARVAAPLDAAVPAEATAPAPAAPALQPEMESAAVHAPADSTADPGPAGRIGQEPQLAGPAVSNDLSDQRPGNDLIEVLEELCRERGLDFTAIDAVIRRRLAAVPDALRFRPGFGAGAGSAALDFSVGDQRQGLEREQLAALIDCAFRQGLIVRAHLLNLSGNELCWKRVLDLRAVFEGLARGHAANVCLRHLLLARCGLNAEALSMVSWRVAVMQHVASLDVSHNPGLGAADAQGGCELLDQDIGILARLLSSSPLRMLCLQYTGMSVASLQRLCGCVASPGVSAPLRVLQLGPAADGLLADDFVTAHLLPMLQACTTLEVLCIWGLDAAQQAALQARTSLEVLCVWGMDVAQQSALQDGWSAVCGTVLECEDIEDGGTRVWIRDCTEEAELPRDHILPKPVASDSLSDSPLQDMSEDSGGEVDAAQQSDDDVVAGVRTVLRGNEAERRRRQRKRKRQAALAAACEAGELDDGGGMTGGSGVRGGASYRQHVRAAGGEAHAAAVSRGSGSAGGSCAGSHGRASEGRQLALDRPGLPRLAEIDRPRDRPAPYLGECPELPGTPPASRRQRPAALQAAAVWGTPPDAADGNSGSGSEHDGSGRQHGPLGRHRRHHFRLPVEAGGAAEQDTEDDAARGELSPEVDPRYSRAAVQAAHAAGVALRNSLQQPAACKVMLKSHVSGGFWCQCPRELALHLPTVDRDLLFETTDRRLSPSSFHYTKADSADGGGRVWPVVLLQREEGGVGFSGGWRGFAIDLRLKVGDAVVYEVLSPQRIRVHIRRAADFDPCGSPAISPLATGGISRRQPGSRQQAAQNGTAEVRARGPWGDPASPSGPLEYDYCDGSRSQRGHSASPSGGGGSDAESGSSGGSSFVASDHEDEEALRRGRREVAAPAGRRQKPDDEEEDGPANLQFFGWDGLRDDQPAGEHFQAASGGRRAPRPAANAVRQRALEALRAKRGRRGDAAAESAAEGVSGAAHSRDTAAGSPGSAAGSQEGIATEKAAPPAARETATSAEAAAAPAAEVISLFDSEPQSEDLPGGLPPRPPRQVLLTDSEPQAEDPTGCLPVQPPSQGSHQRRALRVLSDSEDEAAPAAAAAALPAAAAVAVLPAAAAAAAAVVPVASTPSAQPGGDAQETPRKHGLESAAAQPEPSAAAHGQQPNTSPGTSPAADRENSAPNTGAAASPSPGKRQRLLSPGKQMSQPRAQAIGSRAAGSEAAAEPAGVSLAGAAAETAAAALPPGGGPAQSPAGLGGLAMSPRAMQLHSEAVRRRKSSC